MPRDGSGEAADYLWTMAAELEQQFAGYKQRLAERNAVAAACVDDASGGGGGETTEVVESGGGDDSGDDVRGRMYEAYVRRRDERLRQGWLARMERKEAEVKAFWAQLELSGRASGERALAGGLPTTTTDASTAAGDGEGKTERDDDDDDDKKRRSADATLAPRRISGKKHARTRSFSSSFTNPPDDVVGRRRVLSQELPSSQPQGAAGGVSKENRARPAGSAATATSRPKASLRCKDSVKGHGGAKQTGSKIPCRRGSSGGLQDLVGREVVPPRVDAAAAVLSRSDEEDVHGETPKSSPRRPSASIGDGTGAANVQTASPDSDGSEVVDAVPPEGKPKVKNADAKKRDDEDVVDASSPDKPNNPNGGIITSDSDIESNYVYICRDDIVEVNSKSLPQTQVASAAVAEFSVKTNDDDNIAETMTPPAGATTTAIATTNAEQGPKRESSGESSFSGRLGRSPQSSAAPSCSSRDDQSIERVLEADAALLRKKRAEKSTTLMKTPAGGAAGSRVSAGTAWLPKEKPRGFKRFLSFGKKNRAREVTVVDCTLPLVSSVAGDDSGRWQSAGSIKPRMGFSDCTDHRRTTSPRACSLQNLVAASPAKSEPDEIVHQVKSPKAHRSFFSFLWLDCGRG